MRKPPDVQEALKVMARHLQYVIQMKDPEAGGEEGEWKTLWEEGPITGKKHAYDRMNELKERAPPRMKWRILKKNEADAFEQGIEVGRKLAGAPRRSPLRFLPENI